MVDELQPLSFYDRVVVCSSGGKDSQTALRFIMAMAGQQGYDHSKIIVSHQCLGRMEWPGTLNLVKLQAKIYGLRVEVESYRDKAKQHLTLLDYVRKRRMWPSSTNRCCTSEFKRGASGRVLTRLGNEVIKKPDDLTPARILNIFGFRAEESSAGAKRKPYSLNTRFTTLGRQVFDYLPIHTWTEEQVWEDIHASGVPHHWAYDEGMQRLSCTYCIFAPRNALLTAAWLRPDLLQEYVDLETEIGHDFQHKKPLRDIQAAMLAGERPVQNKAEKWSM